MKKIATTIAAALTAIASWAITTPGAQQAIDALASDSALEHASMSIAVADIAADTIVASHNIDLACITASTMKTVTSATALLLLSPSYTFHTPVYLVGEVKGNKFKGDIVIKGSGDPTLGSAYCPATPDIVGEITSALQQRGIKKVTGQIVAVDTLIPFPGYNGWWDCGDLSTDYGMGVHGINYSDNRTHLKFTGTGNGTIAQARFEPPAPGVGIVNRLDPGGSNDALSLYLDTGNPAVVLAGEAAARDYDILVACPTPAAMLTDSLQRALSNQGIKFKLKPGAAGKTKHCDTTLLVMHKSPKLASIVSSLLDRSDNMWTEALLRAIALHSGRRPTANQGVEVVDSLWQASGLDTGAKFQYDGSGLARANKNSARFFVKMLDYMATHPVEGTCLHQLMPKAGKRIGKLLPATSLSTGIVLKSGSMTQVQCYVGYYPASNPRYSWAVLINNWNCSRAELKNKIDNMLIGIFGDKD